MSPTAAVLKITACLTAYAWMPWSTTRSVSKAALMRTAPSPVMRRVDVFLWGLKGEDGCPRRWPSPLLSYHDIEYIDGKSNLDNERIH
ncbi:hypothetical protein HD806DRAFT_534787 [Xylariaceae sp. AK1471]|nr:hypothetical protein HD806DRAFT_534787 [Xylariaceae sp. AK1471]